MTWWELGSGSVSWTENESAGKALDLNINGARGMDVAQVLVAVKNPGSVDLSVGIYNLLAFDSTAEACELVASTDFTVPAGTAKSKVVEGLGCDAITRLTFTKSSATAPAFSAYAVIRKLIRRPHTGH